ncbi:hypothetical protein OF829_11550 [Sphingomonas sp. LB-2]|nr:hypothetical protein [Sphingomonas caeni]
MVIFAIAMALLAPGATALIAQAGEWLAMPMPEGFVTAHQQTAQVGSIEERIPQGETVEQWTRMITLITLNTDSPPEAYAAEFDQRLQGGCPGARSAPHTVSRIGTRAAFDGQLDCPRNPATGKPETLFYRVTSAGGRLHMVQVAFRSVPDAQGVAWARERIGSAVLCTPRSTEPACKR